MPTASNPVVFWIEVAALISGWIICVVMLFYIPFRKDPSSARTWLLLIFLMPWIGFLLYLLLGRAYMPRKRLRIQRKALERIKRAQAQFPEKPHEEPQGNLRSIMSLVSRIGEFTPEGGNNIELISNYDESIRRLIRDISEAKRHAHLLYYIFADDDTGNAVGDALIQAAKRGVKCRLLMDSIGSSRSFKRLAPRLKKAGVEVVEMLQVGLIRSKTVRFDLRNHRKIAIIDGAVGYLGSQNIVDARLREDIVYEELVVRLQGPILTQLQMVFLADWYLETDSRLNETELFAWRPECGESLAQLLPSGPGYGRANFQMLMVTLLHNARSSVMITTPYFIPDQPLLQAMETAVLRGVEVRLLVSAKSDQKIVSAAQQAYYEQLLKAGVHVHRYQPRFLHAKVMTVDESIAVIGSSNVDIRSFALNSEISLIVYDANVVDMIKTVQERYLRKSRRLTPKEWNQRSLVRKMLQSIARLADAVL
jgi:cardiolipin synthase